MSFVEDLTALGRDEFLLHVLNERTPRVRGLLPLTEDEFWRYVVRVDDLEQALAAKTKAERVLELRRAALWVGVMLDAVPLNYRVARERLISVAERYGVGEHTAIKAIAAGVKAGVKQLQKRRRGGQ